MEKLEPLWVGKIMQPLWKTVRQVLKELKVELLYDPAIVPLVIQPKKLKAGS